MPEELAKPPLNDAYRNALLKLWIEISGASIDFRESFLTSSLDPQTTRDLVNQLVELWLQIYPKVIGWQELEDKHLKELASKIKKHETYYLNPALLLEDGFLILEFQKDLRMCLEALGITSIEQV